MSKRRKARSRRGRLYVFEWADGSGTIGSVKARRKTKAEENLVAELLELKHYAVLKSIAEGKEVKMRCIVLGSGKEKAPTQTMKSAKKKGQRY